MQENQARQMHAGGKSFREIAKELGSDVPTVKRWITGSKGGLLTGKQKRTR